MEKIKFEFDASKILKKIIETDASVHENIRKKVEETVVQNIVWKIENEFFKTDNWGEEKVRERIMDELKEKVDEVAKKILKEFYNSWKYKPSEANIMKKLKDLLNED